MFQFQKARREVRRLRLAMFGPSGAGKTYSALRLATGLAEPNGRIAVIDTEHGASALYADRFEFDMLTLDKAGVDVMVQAIQAAAQAGYEVLIVDSLSHAWAELLEEIDTLARAKYGGNTWSAWSEGTPKQKRLIRAILSYPGHFIATMRAKTEWAIQTDNRGKVRPVRVGLAPEQGKGIEYEFDMLMMIAESHEATIIKDRTGKYQDKVLVVTEDFGRELRAWLEQGEAPAPRQDLTENGKQPEPRLGPEPKAEPVQSAEPVQAPERPMSPEALRAWLREQAAALYRQGFRFPDRIKGRGPIIGALEQLLGGEEERRTFLEWAFGKRSTKDLGDHTMKALGDWMQARYTKGQGYTFPGEVIIEATDALKAAYEEYNQVLREAGQQDLPLEEMQAEMNRALFGEA